MGKKFPDYVPPTQIAYRDDGGTTLHLRKCRLAVQRGERWEETIFDQTTITIGAMEDNDLTLRDETVSRYHCRISQEGNAYVLQDLNSTNGSFIDKVRIKEAYLTPGCVLSLGKTKIRFQSVDEQVHIRPLKDERFGEIIGTNVRMRELFGILEKIAPSDATVIIEGETGTGKEVVARTIHEKSLRAKQPFIIFDCSAVPENLIESELFGHEKGSFTGAIMARPGLFEMAHNGTIFLDELGELSVDLQPKLLRVLETREVRRVGGTRSVKVNVRVVAATNRKLEEEVKAGRFRQDLYYRLSVVRIFLPSLRERPEDIPLLVRHFLRQGRFNRDVDGQMKVKGLSIDTLNHLLPYPWPGNVRELLNVMERACSFCEGVTLSPDDLPRHVIEQGSPPPSAPRRPAPPSRPPINPLVSFKDAKEQIVSDFEREYIFDLLQRHQFNISHASREADIDRKYFRKLMKKYEIAAPTR
ncbi:sigma 54-interacting transcriptional regulator [Myxococcota bacterium]|nr:sigma 54-interacting transcriptional regulator [Myxococcota bacterium]